MEIELNNLTHNDIPYALTQIYRQNIQLSNDVKHLQKLLFQKNTESKPEFVRFNFKQLAEYLKEYYTEGTLYQFSAKHKMPRHKQGKKLYFLKSEIDQWLEQNREKTLAEIDAEVDAKAVEIHNNKMGLQ